MPAQIHILSYGVVVNGVSSPSSVLWAWDASDTAAAAAAAVMAASCRRTCGSSRSDDIRLAQRAPPVVFSVEPLVDALCHHSRTAPQESHQV